MGDYTINLSIEEEKALLTNMISIQEWADNAIHNKARQCIDKVCERALSDSANTILTKEEKQSIASRLATEGQVISTVNHMPLAIKAEIVQKARIKSAAEEQAEKREAESMKGVA